MTETKTDIFASGIEWKALSETGVFEGYASTFGNVDNGGDIVAPTAFDKALKEGRAGKYPKLCWQHRMSELVGVITEMKKDDVGLLVKGQMVLDVQQGREAYALMKAGAIDSMSIGYIPIKWDVNSKTGIRTINEVRLLELSLVTFPMNERARITSVKADKPETEREFEGLLRDAGFSQREAKAITAKGFKYGSQRDVDPNAADSFSRNIERVINILEK